MGNAPGTWRTWLGEHGCDVGTPLVRAVDLTAALLRVARNRMPEVRVDHGDPALAARLAELTREVATLISARVTSEYLRREVVHQLGEALDATPLRAGIAALTTAQVLDVRLGRAFIDGFQATEPRRLAPGDPVPIVRFPSERLDEAAAAALATAIAPRTGNPGFRTEVYDRVDHLRLAPEAVRDLPVYLSWADPWLDPIRADTRLACGVTNNDLEPDLRWRKYDVDSRRMFYAVEPSDPAEQRRRLELILDGAAAQGATVLVLPELSVTEPLLAELGDARFAPFALAVAGSYHVPTPENEPGRNVSVVFANGERLATHRKFTDFHYGDPDKVRRHEHLRRDEADGFHVHLSPACSAVVLICKDALDERVARLLQALAPNLVLVPAMSPEVADFELLAERLARDPQGFTVIACAGPSRSAIVGRPNRDLPVISEYYTAPSVVSIGIDGVLLVTDPSLSS